MKTAFFVCYPYGKGIIGKDVFHIPRDYDYSLPDRGHKQSSRKVRSRDASDFSVGILFCQKPVLCVRAKKLMGKRDDDSLTLQVAQLQKGF